MTKDIFEFGEKIEQINNCIEYYENKDIDYTRYKLLLSNGEEIEISYDRNSIGHLLGIDTNYLQSTGIYKDNSYNILKDIIENPNKLYNQIKNNHIKENNVFSEYTETKLDNFKNICGINIFDIEFIVKYEKNKNVLANAPLDDGYYIGYVDSSKLSVVGYTQSNKNDLYFPHTNLQFKIHTEETEKFLNRLLTNQTLTSITTLRKNIINENNQLIKKVLYYNSHDKLQKLKTIKRYADMYNGSCDTREEAIFNIDKVSNLFETKENISQILDEISIKIKNKKMIDSNNLEQKYNYMDEHILNIISSHNDSLVTKNDENNEYSYKEIIEGFNNCKNDLLQKENLINKLNEKIKSLTEENESLKEENKNYKQDQEDIQKILQRRK